jgi:hypothetical protein
MSATAAATVAAAAAKAMKLPTPTPMPEAPTEYVNPFAVVDDAEPTPDATASEPEPVATTLTQASLDASWLKAEFKRCREDESKARAAVARYEKKHVSTCALQFYYNLALKKAAAKATEVRDRLVQLLPAEFKPIRAPKAGEDLETAERIVKELGGATRCTCPPKPKAEKKQKSKTKTTDSGSSSLSLSVATTTSQAAVLTAVATVTAAAPAKTDGKESKPPTKSAEPKEPAKVKTAPPPRKRAQLVRLDAKAPEPAPSPSSSSSSSSACLVPGSESPTIAFERQLRALLPEPNRPTKRKSPKDEAEESSAESESDTSSDEDDDEDDEEEKGIGKTTTTLDAGFVDELDSGPFTPASVRKSEAKLPSYSQKCADESEMREAVRITMNLALDLLTQHSQYLTGLQKVRSEYPLVPHALTVSASLAEKGVFNAEVIKTAVDFATIFIASNVSASGMSEPLRNARHLLNWHRTQVRSRFASLKSAFATAVFKAMDTATNAFELSARFPRTTLTTEAFAADYKHYLPLMNWIRLPARASTTTTRTDDGPAAKKRRVA